MPRFFKLWINWGDKESGKSDVSAGLGAITRQSTTLLAILGWLRQRLRMVLILSPIKTFENLFYEKIIVPFIPHRKSKCHFVGK
jgi:hypothetical protein